MTKSFGASPKAVDANGDGYVDKVYLGDLGGQMWVFDVSFDKLTKKSDSKWSGRILFAAPGVSPEKHPIYYQPAVAFDSFSNLWVYSEQEKGKSRKILLVTNGFMRSGMMKLESILERRQT